LFRLISPAKSLSPTKQSAVFHQLPKLKKRFFSLIKLLTMSNAIAPIKMYGQIKKYFNWFPSNFAGLPTYY
jgi:hypothetical protein